MLPLRCPKHRKQSNHHNGKNPFVAHPTVIPRTWLGLSIHLPDFCIL